MTPLELALTSLSEATAITLHQDRDSQCLSQLRRDAVDAGRAGGKARKAVEEEIGRSAVSSQNYLENAKQKRKKPIGQKELPLFNNLDEKEDDL